MKFLWLYLVLPAVFGHTDFGQSYLKNTRLCHHWNCINTKLGLPDILPPRNVAGDVFKRVLPQGPWQNAIDKVLDNCYGNRTRRYTNTCPGQALLHCVVDEMINNCPDESARKNDACSPLSSLAGLKYMFSQSRYQNLEKNLPQEGRPPWFMHNYFDHKCCEVPTIFNTTVLEECGFSTFINYYDHKPKYESTFQFHHIPTPAAVPIQTNGDIIKVVDLNQSPNQIKPSSNNNLDPLDCCDIKEFIQPSWRSECGFHLNWKGAERLVIANDTDGLTTQAPTTTTTASANVVSDLMLLPNSCEQENCLFKKLGVIDEGGVLITLTYMNILNNFTDAHPNWKKAAARVVTKCLTRRTRYYDGECEINKILSCTLDLLTENCPYKRKSGDSCRHNRVKSGCQISSSKFSPKSRREICLLPEIIHRDHLSQCGMNSLYKVEHMPVTQPKPRKYSWATPQYLCQDQKPPTTCLMTKMGILNKYKFMDYFRMKDSIRQFTVNQPEWSALLDTYTSAFINIPMYGEHCSSQKKLLNVIDAMLMTCPVSKRVDSPQCTKFFKDITDTTPLDNQNVTKQKQDEILKHYHHIFLPNQPMVRKYNRVIRKQTKTIKKPIYNYGLLDSKFTPKVETINIKPVVITRPDKPLVLAPVYLRDPKLNIATPFHNDGVFRSSNPYWLHDKIAKAHITTPSVDSVKLPGTNLQSTTTPLIPEEYTEPVNSKLRMFKPE